MSERRALIALVLVFVALLFAELPGSWLMEPDEARYAEIPREMLATHDFVTPSLNDAHYFEKPPLLYWANALSMRAFGLDAYAARLPTRLAALGTAAIVAFELETPALPGWGLWAALILLSAPLSFVLGRYNVTDGLLTCAMTGAFFALRRFLAARERGARAPGALAALGACAALAVLTKGLIGIVFPGLVLLIWAGVTGRWRRVAVVAGTARVSRRGRPVVRARRARGAGFRRHLLCPRTLFAVRHRRSQARGADLLLRRRVHRRFRTVDVRRAALR